MIHASRLRGLSVIDLDAAERLGEIIDIVLAPDRERLAGFLVSPHSQTLLNGGAADAELLPASTLHAIGPDAVTVHREKAAAEGGIDPLTPAVNLSELTGRKVVSQSGRMLGTIEDVLIDNASGARIVAYTLADANASPSLTAAAGVLGALFGGGGKRPEQSSASGLQVRADADLRIGSELMVVLDDAVISSSTATAAAAAPQQGVTESALNEPMAAVLPEADMPHHPPHQPRIPRGVSIQEAPPRTAVAPPERVDDDLPTVPDVRRAAVDHGPQTA